LTTPGTRPTNQNRIGRKKEEVDARKKAKEEREAAKSAKSDEA